MPTVDFAVTRQIAKAGSADPSVARQVAAGNVETSPVTRQLAAEGSFDAALARQTAVAGTGTAAVRRTLTMDFFSHFK